MLKLKAIFYVFQFDVDEIGDTVIFPDLEEMDLYTNIKEIIINFDVVGSHYGMCDLVIHGCSGEFQASNYMLLGNMYGYNHKEYSK